MSNLVGFSSTPPTGGAGVLPPTYVFEDLRGVRQKLAADRSVPPYLIFGDATLRDDDAVEIRPVISGGQE